MHAAPRGPKLQLKSPIELALRGVLAHPAYLVFSLVLAILAGGALAYLLKSEKYHFTGKMLYVPNRVTEPFYVSPDLRNLTGAIVNSGMLGTLHDRWSVDEGLEAFRERLRFDIAGEATLDTTYSSTDKELAQKLLQDSMEHFIGESRKLRSGAIAKHVKDFEREIRTSEEAKQAADIRLEKKLRPFGLKTSSDLTAAIVSLRQSISESENRIAAALDRRQLSKAQFDSLLAMRSPEKKPEVKSNDVSAHESAGKTVLPIASDPEGQSMADGLAKDSEASAVDTGLDDSPRDVALASFESSKEAIAATYDLQKQKLLEDRIQREKELASFNVKVDVMQKEFERAQSLHQRELISDAAFEKTKGELAILLAEQTQQVKALETQLAMINGRIDVRTENLPLLGAAGSAAMGPAGRIGLAGQSPEQQTIALLRGSEVAADVNLEYLNNELNDQSDRLSELTSLKKEIEPLVQNLDNASDTLNRLQVRSEMFEQTARSSSDELIIVQDATAMIDGVSSNGKKLFAAGFVGSLICLMAPMFLTQLKLANDRKPETQSVFGIPVLGRKPTPAQTRREPIRSADEMNRIAIRIRQKFGKPRGVLTIAGDCQDDSNSLLTHVANELQGEGHSTAIIDGNHLKHVDSSGVRTSSMNEPMSGRDISFNELIAQTDFVLISAPLSHDALQLETAAIRSDGIVLVSSAKQTRSPQMQRTLADLTDIGSPILGVVVDQ